MKHLYLALLPFLLLLFAFQIIHGQVNFTANDVVPEYNAPFGFGTNPGGHRGWSDEQLSNLSIGGEEATGIGANTLRPALTEKFLEAWNYNIRVEAFKSYAQRGADQNVVFIGYPSEEHRSTAEHCPGKRSEIFANIYQDIWDNNANGTPYNDNNHYAAYVYEMVNRYKDYIRFYEVWNEPDFPRSTFLVQNREDPRNWWDNNPNPCDFELHAPIFHYIRMLRITYEVVKTLDPDAYVAVGGLGKTAFLDAILRNTDNFTQGQVTAKYPLKGGAYFDVLSYHSYPHIDGSLQQWNNDRQAFDYLRNSDAAVDGMIRLKDEFEEVLFDYGYNGSTYPEKKWIITETNVPRKTIGDRYGNEAFQVNYIIKAMVEAQREGILQVHPYKLGDTGNENTAVSEFDLMGMYNNLRENPPYTARYNNAGIGFKMVADALRGKEFDATQTAALNLPEGTRGAAFLDDDGTFTYVLWATAAFDRSEFAKQTIDLSALLGTATLEGDQWRYSVNTFTSVDPSQIELTASPLIIYGGENSGGGNGVFPANVFSASPNPFVDELIIEVRLAERTDVAIDIINHFGTVVTTVVNTSLAAGQYQYPINTSTWENGIYFMQVRTGGVDSIPIWIQLVKLVN